MSQPPQDRDRDRPDWRPWDREPDQPEQRAPGEPSVPAGRPAAPGWGPPSPQYGQQPPYGQPPQFGQQPPYGQPAQYPPSQYGQYGHPQQYPPPQYGQPQYGQAQYGQAQYGQAPAGWGQPAQPARRRSRRLGLLLGIVVLGVAVVVAVAQGSGLGGTRLDPDAVQRDVAEQFEELEGVALELTCDEEMTVEPDRSYRCQGRTADDERVTVTITLTDDEGGYTWADR